jgi:hypothetical protein
VTIAARRRLREDRGVRIFALIVALAALVMSDAGCGFERQSGGDGGGCQSGSQASCTTTKARGFEPLGTATMDSSRATFASAGTQTEVVWESADSVDRMTGTIYGALVNELGAVGSPRQLAIGVDPALFRVNDQLTLFWRDSTTIYMQLMDDSGALLNQPRTVFAGTADPFVVDWSGSDWGLIITGANGDPFQLYWLRLDASGVVAAGPTKLAQGGNNSLQPAIAWTGCDWAIAWTDTRPGTPAVFFARLAQDFSRLSDDTMLSEMGVRGSFPTVAPQTNGGAIVCYEELVQPTNQEVVCTRVDAAGQPTFTQKLTATATPSQNPHAVAHGHNTWVLWDDFITSPSVPNVQWQFLDETGAPILAQPRIDPDVAPSGWRAHGWVGPDALYFAQFYGDPGTGSFIAQVVTENCF